MVPLPFPPDQHTHHPWSVAPDPWLLTQMDARFFGKANPCLSRREVLEKYCDYVDKHTQERKYVEPKRDRYT